MMALQRCSALVSAFFFSACVGGVVPLEVVPDGGVLGNPWIELQECHPGNLDRILLPPGSRLEIIEESMGAVGFDIRVRGAGIRERCDLFCTVELDDGRVVVSDRGPFLLKEKAADCNRLFLKWEFHEPLPLHLSGRLHCSATDGERSAEAAVYPIQFVNELL